MLLKLFLAFAIIPFIELYLLITIGTYFGAINTIIIVILTALSGALLARIQGMQTMMKVRESLGKGEIPAEEILDALLIFLAGITLLTPGFLTDLLGLLILIPATRQLFKQWLRRQFDKWVNRDRLNVIFYD